MDKAVSHETMSSLFLRKYSVSHETNHWILSRFIPFEHKKNRRSTFAPPVAWWLLSITRYERKREWLISLPIPKSIVYYKRTFVSRFSNFLRKFISGKEQHVFHCFTWNAFLLLIFHLKLFENSKSLTYRSCIFERD